MTQEPAYSTFPKYLAHAHRNLATRDDGRLLLVFHTKTQQSEIDGFFARQQEVFEREDAAPPELRQRVSGRALKPRLNQTQHHVWVRLRDGGPPDTDYLAKLLAAEKKILDWIGPVYRASGSPELRALFCPPPTELMVIAAEGIDDDDERLGATLKELGLKKQLPKSEPATKEQSAHVPVNSSQKSRKPFYCVPAERTSDNGYRPGREWYDQAGKLSQAAQGLIQTVQYDSIPLTSPLCMVEPPASEVHWDDQWNLDRIGMPAAWDYGLGDEHVYVCVIDNGCQSVVPASWANPTATVGYHPELSRVGNYGQSGGALGEHEGGPSTPSNVEGPHATGCAGIAAAEWGSAGGVVGVAPGCCIFSLALPMPFAALAIANAIRTAADPATPLPNRDVGDPDPRDRKHRRVILLSAAHAGLGGNLDVQNAIQFAVANDVVVCVPTGNDDSRLVVTPPADNSNVIAVGAMDGAPEGRATNQYPTPGTLDLGPGTWGSNGTRRTPFVSAPGVEVPTTDLRGAGDYDGYIPGNNYVMNFSGTSAGAAHVAGLAALLLSHNPRLAERDVRRIMGASCEKFAGVYYAYPNSRHPDGTWNQDVGYGLIDASAAVTLARAPRASVAPTTLDFGSVKAGDSKKLSFEVTHLVTHCTRDLEVEISAPPANFKVNGKSEVVNLTIADPGVPPLVPPAPPPTVAAVEVTFKAPSVKGAYSGTVTVTTDDPLSAPVVVQLTGTSV